MDISEVLAQTSNNDTASRVMSAKKLRMLADFLEKDASTSLDEYLEIFSPTKVVPEQEQESTDVDSTTALLESAPVEEVIDVQSKSVPVPVPVVEQVKLPASELLSVTVPGEEGALRKPVKVGIGPIIDTPSKVSARLDLDTPTKETSQNPSKSSYDVVIKDEDDEKKTKAQNSRDELARMLDM